jgi:hypothetical protein
MAHLLNQKQCDRHCFMGYGESGQLDSWNTRGKWIDLEDYEHLVTRMSTHPDPEVLYVSGILDAGDTAYLGPFFRLPAGIPDRVPGDPGDYRLLFFDASGFLIQSVGFPAEFAASEFEVRPPATFFGFSVPWKTGTATIQIVRQGGGSIPAAIVAERSVSASPPTVVVPATRGGGLVIGPGETLDLSWQADDEDGDELLFVVQASLDGGDTWGVLRGWIEGETSVQIPSATVPEGDYLLQVSALDGVHLGSSQPIAVQFVGGVGLLFRSGFESGDTSEWSGVSP